MILVNNFFVEVYDKPTGVPDYWKSKGVRIYDPLEDITEKQERYIVQYLYDEGFIQDRRVDSEVITGEDCNG